jgi:hypothetical protein
VVLLAAAIKPLISGGLKTVDGFDGSGYTARGFAACADQKMENASSRMERGKSSIRFGVR